MNDPTKPFTCDHCRRDCQTVRETLFWNRIGECCEGQYYMAVQAEYHYYQAIENAGMTIDSSVPQKVKRCNNYMCQKILGMTDANDTNWYYCSNECENEMREHYL